ncbi:hypothetical protein GCM10010967_12320 [Dyadobacter beijingensis]|uniref:Uncharacterized protein n=1 Tax=Dyadobacter beijingensis TaxID=365489 RepID=A0ABQ2HHR0_9BACT|nr:hypothetical protein GCM10010967_12320 [Dyadobacter beijingensis]
MLNIKQKDLPYKKLKIMSTEKSQQKSDKKKPAKNLKEKRADKKEKRDTKSKVD